MPRGQYDRSTVKAKRAHLAPVDAPQQEQATTALCSPLPSGNGNPTPEPAAEQPAAPMRLLSAHGYRETRFNRGVFHWAAGEIITNPDEIAHLADRGARLEPV